MNHKRAFTLSDDYTYLSPSQDRTNRVYACLRSVWNFQTFLPGQERAINAALDRLHVLYRAPTAGGKSLSSQLAALMQNGVTIFVEPHLVIIRNQLASLSQILAAQGWADRVITITSDSYDTNFESIARLKRAAVAKRANQHIDPLLCYLTPERLCQDEFRRVLKDLGDAGSLSRIVFDECHCIYENATFRKSFATLTSVVQELSHTPLTFASATFPLVLREDIIRDFLSEPSPISLPLDYVWVARSKVFRPNLRCQVLHKDARTKLSFTKNLVADCLKRYPHKRGIVFCLTPRDAERMAEAFNECSERATAAHYHSKMGSENQEQFWQEWETCMIRIACATPGFIHGVHTPDVSFVVFAGLPKSIEEWTQGIGRAGRDGRAAECTLYYSADDIGRNVAIMFRTVRSSHEENDLRKPYATPDHPSMKKLAAMAAFAHDTLACRHAYVRRLDAEENASCPSANTALSCCEACDNCARSTNKQEHRNLTPECWQILKILQKAHMAHYDLTLRQLGQVAQGKPLSTRRRGLKGLCLENTIKHMVSPSLYEAAIIRLFGESLISFKPQVQPTAKKRSSIFVVLISLGFEVAAVSYDEIQSGHADSRFVVAMDSISPTLGAELNGSPERRLSRARLSLRTGRNGGGVSGSIPQGAQTRKDRGGRPAGVQCPFCGCHQGRISRFRRHWESRGCLIHEAEKKAMLQYKDAGHTWWDTLTRARKVLEKRYNKNRVNVKPGNKRAQVDYQIIDMGMTDIGDDAADKLRTSSTDQDDGRSEDERSRRAQARHREMPVTCPFCSGTFTRVCALGKHWAMCCKGNRESIDTVLGIAANYTGRVPRKWRYAYDQACALANRRCIDEGMTSGWFRLQQRKDGEDMDTNPLVECEMREDNKHAENPLQPEHRLEVPSMALSHPPSKRPAICPFCTRTRYVRARSLHAHWVNSCTGYAADIRRAIEFRTSMKYALGNWDKILSFARRIAADRARRVSLTVAQMNGRVVSSLSQETHADADADENENADDEWEGVDNEPVCAPTYRSKQAASVQVSSYRHADVTARVTDLVQLRAVEERTQLSASPNKGRTQKRKIRRLSSSDEEEWPEAIVGDDDEAYEPGHGDEDRQLHKRQRIDQGKSRVNPTRGARPDRFKMVESDDGRPKRPTGRQNCVEATLSPWRNMRRKMRKGDEV